TGAAQRARAQREVPPPVERALLAVEVRWEAGRQQGLFKAGRPAGPDTLAVEPGAKTLRRGEKLLVPRVVDHADDQLARDLQADRDAVQRAVVDVVGGAVERV